MHLTTYNIIATVKANPLSIASQADFRLTLSNDHIDIDYILKSPFIFPYCIDVTSGNVLLVETCDNIDIFASSFFYEAQYEYASRLHSISINDLLSITHDLPLTDNILFLHSTGRCGSTLLANALRASGVMMFSEPDIFTQLASLGRCEDDSNAEMFGLLYKGFVQFFARHCQGSIAFKFRAIACEHAEYLASAVPEAKNLFIYRNAIEVARSYARVSGRPLESWILNDSEKEAWSVVVPLIRQRPAPIDGYELMSALWAGPTLRYLDSQANGIWSGALDYVDLISDLPAVLNALLDVMGLERLPKATWDHERLKHSQEGSHLAPGRKMIPAVLEKELSSPDFPLRINEKLQAIDHRLFATMTFPGSRFR